MHTAKVHYAKYCTVQPRLTPRSTNSSNTISPKSGGPALGEAQSLHQGISGDLWLILRECLERKSDGGLALDAI
jgi:hypothetical protein